MSQRASLPLDAVTVTPGYPWRLDLDVLFDNERPADWSDWQVRMHVWSGDFEFRLIPGDGISFLVVDDLDPHPTSAVIPVLQMSAEITEMIRGKKVVNYLIDMKSPGGTVEDYFSGTLKIILSPPKGLLS